MRRVLCATLLSVALTLLLAAPVFAAGPVITDLTSPTHPDPWSSYYSNEPQFAWNASDEVFGSCWLPRYARVVAVSGSYAFVADEGGLEVIDTTAADGPAVVGSCALPDIAFSVAVAGGYAYVGDLWGGLQIVDVSDPEQPHIEGSCTLPGCAKGVAVAGSFVYVAMATGPSDTEWPDNWTGLQIVDVTDPSAPSLAGYCDLPSDAWGVTVSGGYAYVGDGWSGLQVVAIGNPLSPSIVGSCALPDYARSVAVAGEFAYVADSYGGLQVVRISDPTSPSAVGSCGFSDYAVGVDVSGDRAYVGAMWAGLQRVDITEPTAPVVVDSLALPGTAEGVTVVDDLIYVADGWSGLQILYREPSTVFSYSYSLDADPSAEPDDVLDALDDPAHPSVTYTGVANGTWYFHLKAVDSEGNWGPTATFQVNIDHTPKITALYSPTHPDQWWWYANNDPVFAWQALVPPVGSYGMPDWAEEVVLHGDLAYVPDGYGGLQIVDVGAPAGPRFVGWCPPFSRSCSVALDGGYAYVADYAGLQVVDVHDPANPQAVATYPTNSAAQGIEVAGGLAFLAAGGDGLMVFDVSDPTALDLLGTCPAADAEEVALVGGLAYVAGGWDGLLVVNVEDPSSPQFVGRWSTKGFLRHVALAGGCAFLSEDGEGLEVFDLTDPADPRLIGAYDTPGFAEKVTIIDGVAYVADSDTGVLVLDVSDPSAPALLTTCDTLGSAQGTAIAGGYAFVADAWMGLQVLDLNATTGFAYSYVLDQAPDTEPDMTAKGAATTTAFTDVADGVWWFHVRAVDAEGNWGPAVHRQVMIDCTGPITDALSYRTAKRGLVWLQYSVTDDHFGWANVTIDIKSAAGKLLFTMDLGSRETNAALSTVVDRTLAKGRYVFVVHAIDPIGNKESQTGSASFVVR